MSLSLFYKLFEVIFPVFFIIGIGYWFGKKNQNFNTDTITTFASKIGVPSMLFYSLAASKSLNFDTFIKFGSFTFLFVGCFAVLGIILLKILKRNIFTELSPLILPNTGNLGLPICLFAYGENGFSIASSVAAVIMLLHFTLGIFIAKGKISLKPLLTSIPMHVIILSGLFLFFKIKPPQFIVNTTMILAYSTIFLVLTSLGISLSTLKITKKNMIQNFIISVFRLTSGPCIALIIIKYFKLTGYYAGVLFIQCSMPSAILNFLLAKMYSKKIYADNIASIIVMATAMSFVTIPIVVFIALKYFN
jgi:predicted permease